MTETNLTPNPELQLTPNEIDTMISRRRALQLIGAATLGLMPTLSRAAKMKSPEMNILEAINQAGRQRMLSQRMAKLYAQQIKEVRPADARRLLATSMSLFEKQLSNLRQFAQSQNATQIVQTYDLLGTRWIDYKQVVGTEPTLDGLKTIVSLNEQVLVTAHEGTVQLEKLHGGSLGKLVNMAGRQRMLSQRMSKFYFFRSCGISTVDISNGLDIARNEFTAALQTLKSAPENTPDILSWLSLGEGQWMFFNEAVRATGRGLEDVNYHDNNVAVTSENLLQVMDKVTGLYAAANPA